MQLQWQFINTTVKHFIYRKIKNVRISFLKQTGNYKCALGVCLFKSLSQSVWIVVRERIWRQLEMRGLPVPEKYRTITYRLAVLAVSTLSHIAQFISCKVCAVNFSKTLTLWYKSRVQTKWTEYRSVSMTVTVISWYRACLMLLYLAPTQFSAQFTADDYDIRKWKPRITSITYCICPFPIHWTKA